ncbi:hypothetical protein CPC08DRAFT_27588 [Agrocybe pediades]|nr:hypothetical protein CPC08DRAFT_27588 [Agrocybe pediades]
MRGCYASKRMAHRMWSSSISDPAVHMPIGRASTLLPKSWLTRAGLDMDYFCASSLERARLALIRPCLEQYRAEWHTLQISTGCLICMLIRTLVSLSISGTEKKQDTCSPSDLCED